MDSLYVAAALLAATVLQLILLPDLSKRKKDTNDL